METKSEERSPRPLTPSERGLVIVMGAVMLCLAVLSLATTAAMFGPLTRLVEGLAK